MQGHLPFSVNRLTVKTTITRTWEAWACGEIDEFDAGIIDGIGGRGPKKKLSDDEIQVALKYARVEGLDIALAQVNDLRAAKRIGFEGHPPEPGRHNVVWSTVQAAVRSWGAFCHKRQTRKTGSRDKFSLWAVFRHKFALQLQEQLSDIEDSKRTPGWPKLDICQILFIDEHHEKCRIGQGGQKT